MLFKEEALLWRRDKGWGQWGKVARFGPDAESMVPWIIRTAGSRERRKEKRGEAEWEKETAGLGVGDWERRFHVWKRHSYR